MKFDGLEIPTESRKAPHSGTVKAAQNLNDRSASVLYGSDTSTDELLLNFKRISKRSRSAEKQASTTGREEV
ncbi:hypothetical protein MRS44_018325 [Fusarium solani]|uniref:uncharacterized protein n=1 Tax=Fusarium solani TaxID=169388 RepID=UPI0032C4743E|nr:hypothetical protein MRS44_018325 [Fusarium solani]